MASSPPSLVFSVEKSKPILIRPSKPTPHEFKYLSDIDDQEGLRFQIPTIHFYQKNEIMDGRDPVTVVKSAIAQALVHYYPFAGRLREEGNNRKLMVECTGEGIMFIEANASVSLEQFGDALQPPFPGLEDLLFHVPESSGVTRLTCGGFIFALRLNHTMSDAAGLVQFMNAVAEIARGEDIPSVKPVWNRELLNARSPPRPSCVHREYDEVLDTKGTLMLLDDMAHRSFFFGPLEKSILRKQVPSHLRNCSLFEILTACLWRCRTIALGVEDPHEEVRVICIVNARSRINPPLPLGYYGNAFAFPVAVTTVGKLCQNPISYALELVQKAKTSVTDEYMRSLADLMVTKSRPHFAVVGAYLVSDLSRAGFEEIDFGWGKPVYGGPAKGGVGAIPGVASFYIPMQNRKGENGLVVPICLPGPAMERFVVELEKMLKGPLEEVVCTSFEEIGSAI
ncbi:hypothetical protein ACHQM5_016128 [Ranunculus cassubicifolius]